MPTSLALWLLECLLDRKLSAAPSDPVSATPSTAQHPGATRGEEMSVTTLLEQYKTHLPCSAVEQILRDSCCREELAFVAKLYGNWQTLFELLLPGAPLPVAATASDHRTPADTSSRPIFSGGCR